MKHIALLSLLSAAALVITPAPAKADSEGVAAIGGFIGGLIVGKIIDGPDHHRHHGSSVSVEVSHRSYDRYDRDHDRYRDRGHHYGHDRHRGHGYWDTVRVKVWVPGYWGTRYEHGCRVRYHVPGRYEWRTERVWIERPSHGYSSRSYSYRR